MCLTSLNCGCNFHLSANETALKHLHPQRSVQSSNLHQCWTRDHIGRQKALGSGYAVNLKATPSDGRLQQWSLTVNNMPMGYPVLRPPPIPTVGNPYLDSMGHGISSCHVVNGVPAPGSF